MSLEIQIQSNHIVAFAAWQGKSDLMDPQANRTAVAPGYTFYRNDLGYYECPVQDCGMAFEEPDAMRFGLIQAANLDIC